MNKTREVDYAELAQKAAGNHRKFDSYMSGGFPEDWDEDKVFIGYTSNRDSTLLSQSNADAIEKRLKKFLGKSVSHRRDSHWAVGYVDGYDILVYDENGDITDGFKEWCDIHAELEDYPILDEDDYSEREFEATLSGIEDAVRSVQRNCDFELPDNYTGIMFSWFSENLPRAVESSGDTGGYPSEEVKKCFDALGWYPTGKLELDSDTLYCSVCERDAFTKAEYETLKEKSVELAAVEAGVQSIMSGFPAPIRTDESIRPDGTVFCPHCHAKLEAE